MYLFVGWGKPHPTSELCGDPAIGAMNYQKR